MKGLVFVELMRMAETVISEEEIDEILDHANLESDGAYSAVGNYNCGELMQLVQAFGTHLNVPIEDLQVKFGHWMFARFAEGYPEFFKNKADAFEMLEAIEGEVHVEVLKLYPDAELPRFRTERMEDGGLRMQYSSQRPLKHFCKGLIEACIEYFGRPAVITQRDIEIENRHVAEFSMKWAA